MALILKMTDAAAQALADLLDVKRDILVHTCHIPGECLCVHCTGEEATVFYGRRVELFRGLSLLAQHSGEKDFQISQQLRFSMNGVMLDCSRNAVMKPEQVKKLVLYMAAMGLDKLMLYTEDTYEVPAYPYFGHMRGRYTHGELRELDEYCAQFGITLIPCIQTLAHLHQAMRWQCFDDVRDCNDILLCGEEKTYALIESMLKACRDAFRTDRIHIGMDEAFMMGCGKYRLNHPNEDRTVIFCRHLERVTRLCEKYGFRPMIWSDMFFRIANGGEYYKAGAIDEHVTKMVPKGVGLVYWDYYSPDKAHYGAMLDAHSDFDNPTLFAGAAWRWLGYVPAIEKSLAYSRSALDACLEKGVREVFVTAWGDDGSESSFLCALPVMQLYAEYGYCGGATDEELAARLKTCTGQYLSDMLLLDIPNRPAGRLPEDIAANPSKYLLYQDVMMGLSQYHSEDAYPAHYAAYADQLAAAASRAGELGYLYDTLAKLCSVLEIKSTVAGNIRKAYNEGDKNALETLVRKTLPILLERTKEFHRAVEYQWNAENKIFGYDVLDLRLGGLEARIDSAIRRLEAYINGSLEQLPELEEPILRADCAEASAAKEICQPFWQTICTAGRI